MFVSNSHMSRLLCIQDSYPIEDLFITDWSETIVNVSHVEGNSAFVVLYLSKVATRGDRNHNLYLQSYIILE